MRNSDGLYNDGLDSAIPDACKNNGMVSNLALLGLFCCLTARQTTWTYNQVIPFRLSG